MKLATGSVVDGKIVLEGEALPEGTVVTVLAPEGDGTFLVPPELESELDESIAQSLRGETIPVSEALRKLRTH
ncbi:hypothetical protein [Piscinibacter sp.]|uniref:hypothetical protein n=1 Tax=Piscinibacter sp. TaxID=1903157 RepID=UPI0039E315A7